MPERRAFRQLEYLPVARFNKSKMETRVFHLFASFLERQNNFQLAKTKTNKTFQPAKGDQIFVQAGKVKCQPAKCRQCRLCGERWDACFSCDERGSLHREMFQKPTHTNRYIQFSSHHPESVNSGVIECLVDRAMIVSSEKTLLKQELDHIKDDMVQNGYPEIFVK